MMLNEIRRDNEKKGIRTLDIDGSRIPRTLHDTAQEDGYVRDLTLFEDGIML